MKGRKRRPKRVTLDGPMVRRLRQAKGLSQRELADICGFSGHTVISHIENERQRPELETAALIAYTLGVTVDELLRHHYEQPIVIGEPQSEYSIRRDLMEEIIENLNLLQEDSLETILEQVDFQVIKARREMLTGKNSPTSQ